MRGRGEPSDRAYVPDLPAERVEWIRQWHEAAYQASRREAGTEGQDFSYLGLELHVPPEVQPITGTSDLHDALLNEVRAGERVLDMGTGCGVSGILAARAGAEVLAVDINPKAVEAAQENARRNGVADRMEVRLSDVFDAVDLATDGRFDLVVFDPPFRWFEPRDLLEMATADGGYRALTRFVREVGDHLSRVGRVLMFFGTSGDLTYLERILTEERLDTELITRTTLAKDGSEIEYFTYRVTPRESVEGERGVGIHPERPSEFPAIREVVERAFGSSVEAELVRMIRESANYVPELSLVAEKDGRVVGQVMLSYTDLRDGPRTHRVLTLSPVAVEPTARGKGIGSALIKRALQLADHQGQPLVYLEGNPAFYGRFGFTDARESGIHFDLPDWAPRNAGQICKLNDYDSSIKGKVIYPPAFAAAEELRSRMSKENGE